MKLQTSDRGLHLRRSHACSASRALTRLLFPEGKNAMYSRAFRRCQSCIIVPGPVRKEGACFESVFLISVSSYSSGECTCHRLPGNHLATAEFSVPTSLLSYSLLFLPDLSPAARSFIPSMSECLFLAKRHYLHVSHPTSQLGRIDPSQRGSPTMAATISCC
jgi:hypothetical protein